ncbi:MAG: type II secretion system protein [Elusimicrobia bacterium]|nr:type II secretion system protein [Elusimicrobiota bacterium]
MDKERGSTFLEVTIAMMLVAVITSSVFSVAITARQGSGRSMRRLVANQVSRQLSEKLKGYVSGDTTQAPIDIGFRGPSSGTSASTNWSINGAKAPNDGYDAATITDSMGAANALALGTHTITGMLPIWFSGPPYNATMRYVVTQMHPFGAGGLSGAQIPRVEVYVDWTEP